MPKGRFEGLTRDMYTTGDAMSEFGPSSLVINTSYEHIPDVAQWLATLRRGQLVVLQSNNYRAVPEHISSVDSAEEFAEKARLSQSFFCADVMVTLFYQFRTVIFLDSQDLSNIEQGSISGLSLSGR